MIKFFIEPGYDVKAPERDFGNAGVDFYIPKHTDTFAKAFNEKNAAVQSALKAKNKVAEAEAEALIIAAKAEAEANELLSKSITPEILEMEKYKKWNGEMPKYVGGNGENLIINMDNIG